MGPFSAAVAGAQAACRPTRHLLATGRAPDELQDRHQFDAFPDNPAANGVANLGASLEAALRDGRRCPMWVRRYHIPGQRPEDPFVR